jgi:hypothetical protein
MVCNNPAYYPNNASKVNWLLTHLETGPRDAIEQHFKTRQSRVIMWDAFCSLLLEYVGPPITRQLADRFVFAKYKQHKDLSVRDYTEASLHLAVQLPEDYQQVEMDITYLTSQMSSICAYLLVHQIPCTFTKAADMALRIKSNAELLGTGPAYADRLVRRLGDDRSRLASLKKWEGSLCQGDWERDGKTHGQQQVGHQSRKNKLSSVRLEERIQPTLLQATPALPPVASMLAPLPQ